MSLLDQVVTALPFYRVSDTYQFGLSNEKPFYFQKQQCLEDCNFGTITDKKHLPSFIVRVPSNLQVNNRTDLQINTICANGSNRLPVTPLFVSEVIAVITQAEQDALVLIPPTVGDKYLVDLQNGSFKEIIWNGGPLFNEQASFIMQNGDIVNILNESLVLAWNIDSLEFSQTNNGLSICTIGNYTYLIYNGFEIEQIECGIKQLEVVLTGLSESAIFMSELIDVKDFDVLDNEFHKIKISNICNLGNIPYAFVDFVQSYYFNEDTLVGEPATNSVKEKEEDGLGNEMLIFSSTNKIFTLETELVPEYIVDFFNFTTMQDSIYLIFPFELSNILNTTGSYIGQREIDNSNYKVSNSWFDESCFSTSKLEFGMDNLLIDTSCCQELDKEPCLEPLFDVVRLADASEQAVIEALPPNIDDCYLINEDNNPVTNEWGANKKNVACWNGTSWDYTEPVKNMVIKDLSITNDTDLYFYGLDRNGIGLTGFSVWRKFGTIFELFSGTTFIQIALYGFIPDNTFAEIFIKKSSDVLYTYNKTVTKEELFTAVFITGLDSNTSYDIKANVNNEVCQYGNGDIETISTLIDNGGGGPLGNA